MQLMKYLIFIVYVTKKAADGLMPYATARRAHKPNENVWLCRKCFAFSCIPSRICAILTSVRSVKLRFNTCVTCGEPGDCPIRGGEQDKARALSVARQ